ncbi:MAG TPA: Rrf2 family transcriptional regulator [Syntrophales bacterium]|nr:Rrf2 family transcriptional regulator [Syntrophales bacterium]
MKLSTKGRYGVRLMIDLASHYGEGSILLREISEREEISEKYLWQLINPLKAAGLVMATRGAHGGYVLAKPPYRITLKEILQVLEGPMCLVDCVEKPNVCKRVPICSARDMWNEVADGINRILTTTTLADMAERQKTKREKINADSYMI